MFFFYDLHKIAKYTYVVHSKPTCLSTIKPNNLDICIHNIYYNILQYHILHISISDNRHKNNVNITDILYLQFSVK